MGARRHVEQPKLRREGGRFAAEEILRAHFVPLVRHLPKEGTENQYRVKSTIDGQERVVKESNLR